MNMILASTQLHFRGSLSAWGKLVHRLDASAAFAPASVRVRPLLAQFWSSFKSALVAEIEANRTLKDVSNENKTP